MAGSCWLCHGKAVCPTCREAKVMSIEGPALVYRVCPDCCYAEDGFTPTGVPLWTRNPAGKSAAILRYRQTDRSRV